MAKKIKADMADPRQLEAMGAELHKRGPGRHIVGYDITTRGGEYIAGFFWLDPEPGDSRAEIEIPEGYDAHDTYNLTDNAAEWLICARLENERAA